jgi:hypothetical protein
MAESTVAALLAICEVWTRGSLATQATPDLTLSTLMAYLSTHDSQIQH